MTVFDRFRPKWQHSDPSVRQRALEGVTDRGTLETILASNAPEDVRRIAATQLFSDEHVRSHARRSLREAAIRVLTDRPLLESFAEHDSDPLLSALARSRLGEDGAVHVCGICGLSQLPSATECQCGFDLAKGDLATAKRTNQSTRRHAIGEILTGVLLLLLSPIQGITPFSWHFVIVNESTRYVIELLLFLPGCMLVARGWYRWRRPWVTSVRREGIRGKTADVRGTTSWRERWPTVVASGLLLLVGGNAAYRHLTGVECVEREPISEVELMKRVDEVFRALESDPKRLRAESTDQFRTKQSTDVLADFEKNIVPLLKLPGHVQSIWRVSNRGAEWRRSAQSVIAICKSEAPYADTMAIPSTVKEAATVFYELGQPPLELRVTIQLIRERSRWLIDAISVQPYRYREYDAAYFERQGDERTARNEEGDSLIAYLVAEKLSNRARHIDTIEHRRIATKLAQFTSSASIRRVFSQEQVPRDDEFLHFSMEAVFGQALLPRVSFVSTSTSGDGREARAQALVQALIRQAPSLRTDFPAVATREYAEPPIAGKTYSHYGVVVSTDTLHP